ncbi:MAG: TIGR03621 family F420-dependent LLM class oxidoreductase [Chloroflexi bacterium]|nr:TIGR03621 family F420-dependent LLM class oxidoreductase [Chloroflexota bacterium]
MSNRPLRFGVTLLGASSKQEWIAKVKRVEELGYTMLELPDHLGNQFFPPTLALMLAAEISSTLRLSTKVLDNNFRHPALLAKETATLDLLSGGRVEIGLGAGFLETEYRQAGIPFDAPGVRVGRLEEAVHLLKGLFADGPVTFSGRYYTMNGLEGFPKPLQRPHPPILLAGGGKRMLSLAAREADIINLNPRVSPDGNSMDMQDASAGATAQKIAWIREAAGERFTQIELGTELLRVVRTDRGQQPEPVIATGVGVQVALDQLPQSVYMLAGSVDQICEQALANREHFGISHISVMEKDMEAFAPVVARLSGK